MRIRSILVAGSVGLGLALSGQAQVIEVRPKKPVGETPASPASRPAPRIPEALPAPSEAASLRTIIEVDIISPNLVGDPSAQKWGKVFEDLGASVRIRNGRDGQAGVTEKKRGSLRYVNASGLLNRDGEVNFGTHSFRLDETERLNEWFDELKTYGAQGTPVGKPLWGLTRAQFAIVNERMTQPLAVDVEGQSLLSLVKALQDTELPVRLSTVTQGWLLEGTNDRPITVKLNGFSTGTGLAIALDDIGAGVRPVRTPSGKIEYEILPLDKLSDPWPMGWEPGAATPRGEITPELFKTGVVGFEESSLAEVLAAIAIESKTPIIVDTRRSLARKIDVNTVQVSYPRKRIAWASVIRQCVRQSGLYNHYRQDEAGLGFILVAPFEPITIKSE